MCISNRNNLIFDDARNLFRMILQEKAQKTVNPSIPEVVLKLLSAITMQLPPLGVSLSQAKFLFNEAGRYFQQQVDTIPPEDAMHEIYSKVLQKTIVCVFCLNRALSDKEVEKVCRCFAGAFALFAVDLSRVC